MPDIIYDNIPALFRELDAVQADTSKVIKKEIKLIAQDIVRPLKRGIPDRAPMSGMNKTGRLSWENGYSRKRGRIRSHDVKPSFTTKRSRIYAVTSLVKVIVQSPAVAMLDMARFAKTQKGRQMIVNAGGQASRYVYPSVEHALPKVMLDVKAVIERGASSIGRKLR